ncbi:hypothetical protein RJ639_037885 [Escallonia herrerae]|uniref:AP2/ERF domain-containing protein n=1 Tax=Escallonia herrerae TaxID=1293975 RepID=A0AA88WLC6_9ASTE|nr:hypothetical protein RJ639_037885 [Escallonia herrerae]
MENGFVTTQEEAATAYDMAAIEYRGLNAVTNFDLSRYIKWLRPNQQSDPVPNPSPDGDGNPSPSPKDELGPGFFHNQPETSSSAETAADPPPPSTAAGSAASSALGLLLQSSKFKEMLERTSAADCPLTPPEESGTRRRSFPDDIQTFFDYAEGDDVIFGDLNSYASPMFECELDA